ncbi:MAG: O-antigen ligase family protein [Candidatus Moranbacteria bacterium]|nr:O-antigen ligase family protein [Candidatus Moranbacteria bacterium]
MITFDKIFPCIIFFQFLALEKIVIGGMPLYGLEIIFLLTLGILLKEKVKSEMKKIDKGILFGSFIFLAGALFSTLLNSWGYTELGMLKSWFFFPVLYFFLALSLFSFDKRVAMWRGWFLGSSLISLIALLGYFRGYLTYDERLAFPYTSPNFLAYLVTPAIFIGSFLLYKGSGWQRKGVLFLVGISAFVLYQTHSYNAWIALLGAGAVSMTFFLSTFLRKKQLSLKRFLSIIALIAVAISLFVFSEKDEPKWKDIFSQNGRSSVHSRLMIWQSALTIAKDHPINGVGIGNFQEVYLKYQEKFPPYLEWAVPQPHNFILAVWLQAGLLGLLGIGTIFGRLGFIFWQRMRRDNLDKNKEALVLVALWVSFFLYGLFDTPYFRNDLAFLFWTQAYLTYAYSMRQGEGA